MKVAYLLPCTVLKRQNQTVEAHPKIKNKQKVGNAAKVSPGGDGHLKAQKITFSTAAVAVEVGLAAVVTVAAVVVRIQIRDRIFRRYMVKPNHCALCQAITFSTASYGAQ